MAWTPKVWVDRATQHVARFVLTATGNANEYDLTRVWGTVFTEGDKPNAANLNAEFGNVKTELDTINTNLNGGNLQFQITDGVLEFRYDDGL